MVEHSGISQLFKYYPETVTAIQHIDPAFQLLLFRYYASQLFEIDAAQQSARVRRGLQLANGNSHHTDSVGATSSMMESLSYLYLQTKLHADEMLLSPQETKGLFQKHTKLSLPDIVILRKSVEQRRTYITGVGEATIAQRVKERKLLQAVRYENGTAVKEIFPDRNEQTIRLPIELETKYPTFAFPLDFDPTDFRVIYTYLRGAEKIPTQHESYKLPITIYDLQELAAPLTPLKLGTYPA